MQKIQEKKRVSVHTYVHDTHIHTHQHTKIHLQVDTHTHIHTHIQIHTYTCTHTTVSLFRYDMYHEDPTAAATPATIWHIFQVKKNTHEITTICTTQRSRNFLSKFSPKNI